MNITMEQYHTYLSLYDYLGHAAGQQLGAKVAGEATRRNIPYRERDVSNPAYSGAVKMYPIEFLNEYFKKDVVRKQTDSFSSVVRNVE